MDCKQQSKFLGTHAYGKLCIRCKNNSIPQHRVSYCDGCADVVHSRALGKVVCKICKGCGKEFSAKYGVEYLRRYCSSQCRNRSRRSVKRVGICIWCKKDFELKGSVHRLCSDECRKGFYDFKRATARPKQTVVTVRCKGCETEFETLMKGRCTKVFCDFNCKSKHKLRLNRARLRLEKTGTPFYKCDICGDEIKGKWKRKYCDRCRDIKCIRMINGAVIYCIVNRMNGRMYIGSTNNLDKRSLCHISLLAHGMHSNKELLREWNEFGAGAFGFEVLEELGDVAYNVVREVENGYIKSVDRSNLYNSALYA